MSSQRDAGQRRKVIKLLQDFESWLVSKDGPQGFMSMDRLRILASVWNLGDFVAWVHESYRGVAVRCGQESSQSNAAGVAER